MYKINVMNRQLSRIIGGQSLKDIALTPTTDIGGSALTRLTTLLHYQCHCIMQL